MSSFKKLLLVTLFILKFSTNEAQVLSELKSQYPNEDVVTIALKKHIEISESKGKLTITESVSNKDVYLTSNQLFNANESINYNSFNKIKSIKAYTESSESLKKKKNFVKNFEDKDVLINGVFFNDQKKKSFTFPNVTKGSITNFDYKKQITDPHFLPSFIIGKKNPIHKVELSVSFPKSVNVAYTTFNLDSVKHKFSNHKTDKKTTYKWVLNSIPKINRNFDFNPIYYLPQVFIRIESYNKKGKIQPVLSNEKDLYLWYTSLISDINKSDHAELKSITSNLIKGLSSDEDKIKAIYYFVQKEINYIAFEDGLNGFIPRDAQKVYTNKYGDCKDMANLLNQMLKYAGIPSYLTWVGTRDRPFSYRELPTPMVDNHMITTVKLNNNYIFLDATAKYLGYGYPSYFIQGKEALIGIDNFEYEIIKVPEIKPEKNKISFYSRFKLNNDTLFGDHTVKMTGFEKLEMLHKLERKEEIDFDFLESALKYGKKRTEMNDVKYQNLELINDTLSVSFSSKTKNYLKRIDNLIYFKPHLDFSLKKEIVRSGKAKFDKKINYKFQRKYITSIEIPKNLKVKNLPKDSAFKNSGFYFTINYSLSEDLKTIKIKKQITVNTLKIEVNKISLWNQFIKNLNKATKQSIILEKQ